VLSLGTGRMHNKYSFKRWRKVIALLLIPELINIMMDGVSETTHFITRKLFDNLNVSSQYVRLDPIISDPKLAQMDNATPENIKQLRSFGEQLAQEQDAEITRIARALVAGGNDTRRGLMAVPGEKLVFE
jgi:uncharacterized protein